MERSIYISNDRLMLAEYCNDLDAEANYDCWQDRVTQEGYNYKMDITLEAFKNRPIRSRFQAVIVRKFDDEVMGIVSMSPENALPDLAIMIYRPYRQQGYGTEAFALALNYCFDAFELDRIYAGCYETNDTSLRMLKKCGFVPHPEGNQAEEHFESGTPITQLDFVKYRNATEETLKLVRPAEEHRTQYESMMDEWEAFGGRLNPGALRRFSNKQQKNVSYEEWLQWMEDDRKAGQDLYFLLK